MSNFREYIKSIRVAGRYAFTTEEAIADLGITYNAFNCGMYKLRKRGDIVSPAKNFYVIVPPEYQGVGCIPAEDLIPLLMEHRNLNYYVCLLSSALYHGASHQKPQVFQVMVPRQLKPIVCGKIKIEFIYRKSLDNLPIQQRTVKTGYLNLASPELTMVDIFFYPNHVGGLNAIATILSELIEAIDPDKLIALIAKHMYEKAWIQRLGYILEHIETLDSEKQNRIAELIYQNFMVPPIYFAPLASELSVKGKSRNQRWMIIENTTIESDI